MTAWMLVGLGGAAGSLARYHLGRGIIARYPAKAPLGTFLINISGAFLLGLAVAAIRSDSLRLLVADGFLGAYTTFSTMLLEGYMMTQKGRRRFAAGYLVGSLAVGLLCYGCGWLLAIAVMRLPA